MAETWWTVRAVMRYVALNYHPLDRNADAYRLIDSKVADGTFPTRYRIGDGEPVPLDRSEWWRNPRKEGADAFGALEALEWRGLAQLTAEDRASLFFEMGGTAVQRLCAPMRGRGGRPPGEWDLFFFEVIARALDKDGLPDTQAALTNSMADWCAANIRGDAPGEGAIEKKIRNLYRFLEAKGITPSGGRIR